jgi:flagellar biogenesis protein FliO
MICFLALLLHRVLRQRLKHSDSQLSVEQALRTLKSIQLHEVTVNNQTLRGLTAMTPEQITLFDQLGISRPSETGL